MSTFFQDCLLGGANILLPCDNQPFPSAGTSEDLILINWSKVINPVYAVVGNETVDNVIASLNLGFGGEGFQIQGRNNSLQALATAEQGTFLPVQDNQINFQTFGDSPKQSRLLDKLKSARVIAIWRDANGWYRISGIDNGLILQTDTFDSNNEDNGGGHSIELIGTKERSNPVYFLDTYSIDANGVETYDAANSKANFEGLLNPVTLAITGITAGVSPVVTVASTSNMSNSEKVTFKNITWGTDPTDGTSLLNDNSFNVEVIDSTTFRILSAVNGTSTFDTTGGVYGSGGTIQKYWSLSL